MLDANRVADKLGAAITHAVQCGPRSLKSLLDKLEFLSEYGNCGVAHDARNRKLVEAELWPDSAPYSFGFSVYWRELTDLATGETTRKHVMTGGLIYDGPEAPNDGSAPALTVSLTSSDFPCWGCHT